jgi:hypothetical protein
MNDKSVRATFLYLFLIIFTVCTFNIQKAQAANAMFYYVKNDISSPNFITSKFHEVLFSNLQTGDVDWLQCMGNLDPKKIDLYSVNSRDVPGQYNWFRNYYDRYASPSPFALQSNTTAVYDRIAETMGIDCANTYQSIFAAKYYNFFRNWAGTADLSIVFISVFNTETSVAIELPFILIKDYSLHKAPGYENSLNVDPNFTGCPSATLYKDLYIKSYYYPQICVNDPNWPVNTNCLSIQNISLKQNWLVADEDSLLNNSYYYRYEDNLDEHYCEVNFFNKQSFVNQNQDKCSSYFFKISGQTDYKLDSLPIPRSDLDPLCQSDDIPDPEPEYDEFGFENGTCLHKNGTEWDENGFNCIGIHRLTLSNKDPDGFDQAGFNSDGYDNYGFDVDGINSQTNSSLDQYGFNSDGYDEEGYKRNQFNDDSINKITQTIYDQGGFDENGFDENGYNSNGYNNLGYNNVGASASGITKGDTLINDNLTEINEKLTVDNESLAVQMSDKGYGLCPDSGCESFWNSIYGETPSFSEIYDKHLLVLQDSRLFKDFLNTEALMSYDSGTIPVYEFDLNFEGMADLGTHELDFSNVGGYDIFALFRIFLLISAVLAAFRIVL